MWKRSGPGIIAVLTLGLLTGCARDHLVQIGVPAARDFDQPIALVIADVEIGHTGATGLGPDNRPMVTAHIASRYRDRITQDTSFVLRKRKFGLGELYVEVIPGDGPPAPSGHHFTARSTQLVDQARDQALEWWKDIVERTKDPELNRRLTSLRDDFDSLVDSGRERWDEERPELEARADELLEDLQANSDQAAKDFRRWLETTIERGEEAKEQ